MLGTMPATMPATNHSPETLHCLLTRHIIETGHAPGLQKLADLAGLTEEKTAEVLRKLEEMHGVILAPNSLRIWSLHPFALNPTSLWVSTATGGWWANCAWCSLGIWAAIKQDVNIFTSGGGEESSLDFSIESGQTRRKDLLMQLDSWCLRHAHPRGSVLPIDVAVRLADLWFGDYASPDWVRKTPARAAEIFNELGLDKSFWKMSGSFR